LIGFGREVAVAAMALRTAGLEITLEVVSAGPGYQKVTFAASCAGFRGSCTSWLDAGDLERFAGQVHRLWQDLVGSAELIGEHGTDFSLRLTAGGGGHLGVRVEVNDTFARLQLESQTDQTFLPMLHDSLLSLT